jgi:hypothetical protein
LRWTSSSKAKINGDHRYYIDFRDSRADTIFRDWRNERSLLSYMLIRMRPHYKALATAALVILVAPSASSHLSAQWLKYPTAGVPRKTGGQVDMFAPAPRMADGKPDFSGIWTTGEPYDRRALGLSSPKDLAPPKDPQSSHDAPTPADPTAIVGSRQMANIGIDLPGGLPYQPWLAALAKERTDNLAKDDPHIKCLPDNFLRAYGMPHLLKFVHTPGLLVMLNELNAGYRQVFTDARPLPQDPNPTLQGYSSGKWSGETLIIDTIGVRDDTWIDRSGQSPGTNPAPGLWAPRNRGHGRRSQGLQEAVDGQVKAAHRCRHGTHR